MQFGGRVRGRMNVLPDNLLLPPLTRVGSGIAKEILPACARHGSRGLLVHGRSLAGKGILDAILARCPAGLTVRAWCCPGGEPTLGQLQELLSEARAFDPDWIAAAGGGSVLDIAKACAGLLHAPGALPEYHDGADIPVSTVPFFAVPTTAGTGSEATHVCVLTNADTRVKKSIRHPSFMATQVWLDPLMLDGCPQGVIASAGMDALTQAMESFVSRGANWFTDRAALKACALIGGSVVDVFEGRRDEAAMDLLQGSFLAGMALCNARLGLVHGLAHPLGVRYHQPHGLVCAVCLPHVIEFNRAAMGDKYTLLGNAVGGDAAAAASRLLATLGIQSPFHWQAIEDRGGIVRETLASGSTAANPRPVTADDVDRIVTALFE